MNYYKFCLFETNNNMKNFFCDKFNQFENYFSIEYFYNINL